jgi:acetyl-CoA acetyltransferase family protein
VNGLGRPVVLVCAVRTPFITEGGALRHTTLPELGAVVVREAVLRAGLRPESIDEAVLGVGRSPLASINPTREVVLRAGLGGRVGGVTLSAACASGELAVVAAIERIALGQQDVMVAGGVESASDATTRLPRAAAEALVRLHRARAPRDKLRALTSLRLIERADPPAELEGTLTGWSAGEAAETLAKLYGIDRIDQDRWAARSHARARGSIVGAVEGTVVPVPVDAGEHVRIVDADDGPRAEASVTALSDARPAYDRRLGTVTLGNAAHAADGSSAMVLASLDRARAEGWPVLAHVEAWSTAADDPFEEPFGGFAAAISDVLLRAGTDPSNLGAIEMHEPYAAVVLATLARLASPLWAERRLGRRRAVGELDPERVNAWGGSIAFGHPAAATGGRLIATAARRVRSTEAPFALVATGTVGGQGCALLLRRPD